MERRLGERCPFCGRQVSGLGIGQLAAIEHRHDVAGAHLLPQSVMHLPDDAGDARYDVGYPVGIEGNFTREAEVPLEGTRACGPDPDAEFLQLGLAELDHTFLTVILVTVILVTVILVSCGLAMLCMPVGRTGLRLGLMGAGRFLLPVGVVARV